MPALLRSRALAGVSIVFAAVAAFGLWLHEPTAECAPGHDLRDPVEIALARNPALSPAEQQQIVERAGKQVCWPRVLNRLTEPRGRMAATPQSPPGALRAAIEHKAAMTSAKVANTGGSWTPYGQGQLINDDPTYPAVSSFGLANIAGLVAGLDFDPESKRLFAAVSAGGVWLSEAAGGDIATLADQWVDIGRSLPTQSTSDVAWSPAAGGTLLVLTGEHTMDGGAFETLGVYWTNDLGQTWTHAEGIPDGGPSFRLAVDQSKPEIVYAATGRGLYRSVDAGRSFVNVRLPTSDECAGVTDPSTKCFLANIVTDVIVQAPGGALRAVTCGEAGCPVLAAVGWPQGNEPYTDGTPMSPGNGLYRSDSGEVDTFAKVGLAAVATGSPVGFAPQVQIGRVELGAATGPEQDHNFVYAIVDDAVLEQGGIVGIDREPATDPFVECVARLGAVPNAATVCAIAAGVTHSTALNGIYVSPDFGANWVQLADEVEISFNPTTGSALVPVYIALASYAPGVQAGYNMWIGVDPTSQVGGIPSRIVFGLEEVFTNRLPIPLTGLPASPNDFKVMGQYFGGTSCFGLALGLPACPARDGLFAATTTHPDQHDGLFVPDGAGGVWLFAANDGGIFKQHSSSAITDPFSNQKWGAGGVNNGMNTLMIYGFGVAEDGTVYGGLQDNGSFKIEPDTGRIIAIAGGDGVYAAVEPRNSKIAYYQTPGLAMVQTANGGISANDIPPPAGAPHFTSPFMMDPESSKHLVAAGSVVAESLDRGQNWTQVFDLGINEETGLPHQARMRMIDVQGDASYVGWCRPCNVNPGFQFERGLATNVGGELPPQAGSADGWHQATMAGLPNRYIFGVEMHPENPQTVFVSLGGYNTTRWFPVGQYLDTNPNVGHGHVFKSTDAGESFVDISGNLPDIPITALLVHNGQLIAGSDIGAFISSDLDGTDWAPLGDLPAMHVTQLMMQPDGSGKLFASTLGRGMWTYQLGAATQKPGAAQPSAAFGASGAWGWLTMLGLLGFAALRRISKYQSSNQ